MRRFYIRRKDFSQFPLQFYVGRDGVERRLEPGFTYTFAIEPPKDRFPFLHVHILATFARELDARWEIPEAELIRLAAKGLEAWLKNEPVPDDHFNDVDLLTIDAAWYPHGPDGAPALAANPYHFEVETDEPWPFEAGQAVAGAAEDRGDTPAVTAPEPAADKQKQVVFGFTLDVFPGMLIVGYNQFKRKAAEAGLQAQVRLMNLSDVPADVDVLFVPPELAEAARRAAPHSRVEALDNYLNHPSYNGLIEALSGESKPADAPLKMASTAM
jgi:hypothetical protein